MKRSAPVSLLLAFAMLFAAMPLVGHAGPARVQSVPIGSGARFLPATTSFYLALDASSPQWEVVHRLAAYYLESPEADAAQRQLGRSTGMSAQEIVEGIRSWVGGEAFVAVPDADQLRQLSGFGGTDEVIPCDAPGIVIGAAIGNLSAFTAFVQKIEAELGAAPAPAPTDASGGAAIYEMGRSAAGPLFYAAVHDGYALLSANRQLLVDMSRRSSAESLAALPGFGTASRRLANGSLVYFFAQSEAARGLGVVGSGVVQENPANWFAGSLRMGADSLRLDVSADIATDKLGPAARALLAKSPNPVRSAGVVPMQSVVFLSWDNVKLLWDAAVEAAWPDRSQYEQFRRDMVQNTGLDPEDDIVGWMTGELGVVVAPTRDDGALVPDLSLGLGLVIEAREPARAREKLDRIVEAAGRLGDRTALPSTQEIAGLPFSRVPVYGTTALYVGLVDTWAVVASSAGLAADIVAGVRGGGGLDRADEYRVVRTALPDPVQFLGYVDVPQLVAIAIRSFGAAAGDDVAELEASLRPIRGVGLAQKTASDHTDASLFVHVVVPSEPFPRVARPPSDVARLPALVDASKHGGSWWGEDEDVTASGRFNAPEIPARGQAFVRFLREQAGINVGRMARPGEQVELEGASRFAPTSLRQQRLVVRVGSEGSYTDDEIAAYQAYVRCGGALLLLSDGKQPGDEDELAAAFGMKVAGTGNREATIGRYAAILDGDLPPLPAAGGTGLLGWDEFTRPVAFLSDESYLDLDGDGRPGPADPTDAPAVAVLRYGWGRVAFVGTTALLDQPEHPLTTSLVRYLVPDAPWPDETS